ncbi:MAG: hypothetical protein Fur0037_11870 [Planctomycetota bacterium]
MRITVASYNIHKCIGGIDRRCDPSRIAEVLLRQGPDVALLQEVAQNGRRCSGEPQVEFLSRALGLPHTAYFVNVRLGARSGEYGNAILSRFPIAATENVDLTIGGRKARSVLHACLRVTMPGPHRRTLHVFNLHLGLSARERRQQLRRFLSCAPFASLGPRTPALVAGDFNDVWGRLGKLLEPAGFRGPRRPIGTFPAWAPVRALDSMMTRGELEIVDLERPRTALARRASDHLPLFASIRLGPAETAGRGPS